MEADQLMRLAKMPGVAVFMARRQKERRPGPAPFWTRPAIPSAASPARCTAGGIEWGVYGAPETYVVDGKGIIRFKFVGPLTDRSSSRAIVAGNRGGQATHLNLR